MRNSLSIKLAEPGDDREAIFRLRYRVDVDEMACPQQDADHQRRRIEDPLDRHGLILGAWHGGDLIGSVRSNLLRDGDIGPYRNLYGLDRLTYQEFRQTSITTRLLVLPRMRHTHVAVDLATALYALGLDRGILFDYIDCTAHLVPLFTQLGYRCHGHAVHPEYGEVTVMRLNLIDSAHLQSVNSPFLAPLRAWLAPRTAIA